MPFKDEQTLVHQVKMRLLLRGILTSKRPRSNKRPGGRDAGVGTSGTSGSLRLLEGKIRVRTETSGVAASGLSSGTVWEME